jgi:hypothetical protein
VAAVGKELWNRQRREVEPGVSGGGDGGKVRDREKERDWWEARSGEGERRQWWTSETARG